MAAGLEITMTMGCTSGCRIDVDEATATRMNASLCEAHGRALLAVSIKARPAKHRSAPQVARLCPVHSNGDPCCLRQKAGAR